MNIRLLILAVASLTLSACASLPADRGSAHSLALLKSRSVVAVEAHLDSTTADVSELLSQPLDADAAVRVALIRNPRMQALYAQLGLVQADVYDASRWSNPALGFMQLLPAAGGAARTTWTLTQSFTELLFLNYRQQVSRSVLLQGQQRVAQAVLNLEAEVRSAYYRHVLASLIAQLHTQVSLSASVSADYAQSLFQAGNISELQLSRERAAASEARIALQSAQAVAIQARATLMTLLGMSVLDKRVEFVERLNVPVAQVLDVPRLQQWAAVQRVDLAALREQAQMLQAIKTHDSRWRWLKGLSVSAERERETDGSHVSGLGGSVELPLFNQGGGAVLRVQSQWQMTQAELAGMQLSLANAVAAQAASLEQARLSVEAYRQQLIPLRERVVELSQQQQSYMLIGTFELLNAKRESLRAYQEYLQATGDFWLGQVELSRTVGGRLPDEAGEASYGISVGVNALPESGSTGSADMSNMNMGAAP